MQPHAQKMSNKKHIIWKKLIIIYTQQLKAWKCIAAFRIVFHSSGQYKKEQISLLIGILLNYKIWGKAVRLESRQT